MAENNPGNPPVQAAPAELPIRGANPQASLMKLDYVTQLVADGRLSTRPYTRNHTTTITNVNFESLKERLEYYMIPSYRSWDKLIDYYTGSHADRATNIAADVSAMIDLALHGLYNRLRNVLEEHAVNTKLDRMNPRAPVSPRLTFPSLLARVVNSIGMLRAEDGPIDYKILFACRAGTATNFGRNEVVALDSVGYHRLHRALTASGVNMTTIDSSSAMGSYWPTLRCQLVEGQGYACYTTFHPSHYVNEDAILGLLLRNDLTDDPVFSDLGFYAGKVKSKAITDLLAAQRPQGVPASIASTSAARYNMGYFKANRFGIDPAANTDDEASCWIIGRGVTPYFTNTIIHSIDHSEIDSIYTSGFRA